MYFVGVRSGSLVIFGVPIRAYTHDTKKIEKYSRGNGKNVVRPHSGMAFRAKAQSVQSPMIVRGTLDCRIAINLLSVELFF